MQNNEIQEILPSFLKSTEEPAQKKQKVTKLIPPHSSHSKEYNYLNYPILTEFAFATTMSNYLAFSQQYNSNVTSKNRDIRKHNKSILDAENKLPALKYFYEVYSGLNSTKDYNNAADMFNKMHQGNFVKKRLFGKLTAYHKSSFEAIIRVFGGNLMSLVTSNNKIGDSNRVLKKDTIPFNTSRNILLKVTDKNGNRVYDVCDKSVFNHIARLEDVGLVTKTNRGFAIKNGKKEFREFKIEINPQILLLIDGNPPKQKSTENQQVKSTYKNNLPIIDNTTRTNYNKELKSTEKISELNLRRSQASHNNYPADSYRNTRGINNENLKTPGSKILQKIKKLLIEPRVFAEQLANNEYVNYTPLSKYFLSTLKNNPFVNNEIVRQIVIQDKFKQANAIWKNHNKYSKYNHSAMIGSYLNALAEHNENFLISNNCAFSKDVIIKSRISEYRWRIGFAKSSFSSEKYKNFLAPFPSVYFDPTRKSKADACYYGTKSIWIVAQDKKEARTTKKNLQLEAEKQRKFDRKANDLYKKAIKKYINGHQNYNWLQNYIASSQYFSQEFFEALPESVNFYRNEQLKQVA